MTAERRTSPAECNLKAETRCEAQGVQGALADGKVLMACVQRNWVLLSAWGFAVSIVSIHFYFMRERIPLSVASSEVASVIPAIFVLMAWMIVVICAFLSAPLIFAHLGANRSDQSAGTDDQNDRVSSCHPRHLILAACGWVVLTLVCFALLSCLPDQGGNLTLVFILSCVAFSFGVFLIAAWLGGYCQEVPEGVSGETKPSLWARLAWPKWAFVPVGVAASIWQILLLMVLSVFWSRSGWSLEAVFGGVVCVAVLQCAMGWLFWRCSQERRPFSFVFKGALVLMSVAAFSPFYGEFIVPTILSRSVMGGSDCVVLSWSPAAQVPRELWAKEHAGSLDAKESEAMEKGDREHRVMKEAVVPGKQEDLASSQSLQVLFASSSDLYVRPKIKADDQNGNAQSKWPIHVVQKKDIKRYDDCGRAS